MPIDFDYLLSFAISLAVCVLMYTIGKSVKIYFSINKTRNSLTLQPYVCLMFYMAFRMVQKSVLLSYGKDDDEPLINNSNMLDQAATLICTILGAVTIALQSFEWMLYAHMIHFQASHYQEQLSVV